MVQAEKAQLEREFNDNQDSIESHNQEIAELKSELEGMKHVISHTFEEELQSAAVMTGKKRKAK